MRSLMGCWSRRRPLQGRGGADREERVRAEPFAEIDLKVSILFGEDDDESWHVGRREAWFPVVFPE